MDTKTNYKAYTLEQLREYLIVNDINIESSEDLKKIYFDMETKGYFYQAVINRKLDEVRTTISEFAKLYEKDEDVLEKDLIFMGSRTVLEKMRDNKRKR